MGILSRIVKLAAIVVVGSDAIPLLMVEDRDGIDETDETRTNVRN